MPRAPLLVLVDYQYEHLTKFSPHYVDNGENVVRAAGRVLAKARQHNLSIVHVQMKTDHGCFSHKRFESSPIEALKPLHSEPVFTRSHISPFSCPMFAHFMRHQKGIPIYIGGFTGPYAVLSTVIGCVDYGLDMCVLLDLVGSPKISHSQKNDVNATYLAAIGRLCPLIHSNELNFADFRDAVQHANSHYNVRAPSVLH